MKDFVFLPSAAGCTFDEDSDSGLCEYKQGQEDDFDWQLIRTYSWPHPTTDLLPGRPQRGSRVLGRLNTTMWELCGFGCCTWTHSFLISIFKDIKFKLVSSKGRPFLKKQKTQLSSGLQPWFFQTLTSFWADLNKEQGMEMIVNGRNVAPPKINHRKDVKSCGT